MPLYPFHCDTCGASAELLLPIAERDNAVSCDSCQSVMRRMITTPAILGTDTRFFQGHDDGLGEDNYSRSIIRKNAAQQGMSISGKKYFPQLCRTGKTMDPFACCGSMAEVKQKLEILGRGAEGSINVKPREVEEVKKPYRVADKLVAQHAAEEAHRNGLKNLSPREKKQLKETVRQRISPSDGVAA